MNMPDQDTLTGARYHADGHGTISGRVARILALPAVVILVLLAILASGLVSDYRQSQSTSRSVTLALAVQDLTHELQTERGVTAAVQGGNTSFQAEVQPARRRVDAERARVRDAAGDVGPARAGVERALDGLDGLAALRTEVDARRAARPATFTFFTDRISALAGVDVGLDRAQDPRLRQDVAKFQALQDLNEAIAQERAFLIGVFSAGGFAPGEYVRFADMRAARQGATTRFDRLADADERASASFVFGTGAARTTTAFEQIALSAADGRAITVNPQAWWSGLTTVLDDLEQLQQHVGSEIQLRAHAVQQDSAFRLGGLLGVVLLCALGSLYLATLASRAITRPLAALAAEANSVAVERLPAAVSRVQTDEDGSPPLPLDPVRVPERSTQEIRSVAKALDRLQSAAYGLATDQAVQRRDTIEALANLGRRNQNLIRRQLGFITTLEREEVDPTALANLFELDHLATRMRRNASSLLVLVGASSPRQWTTAVPVGDVVRAAVSEVEEYRRVNLRRVDDTLVNGSVIGSVAHLLSELIENGLTFSPPDTEVEVQGRRVRDGYLIAITDQGVGMSHGDLRQANARLRGEGDFIAAPTRFLGHYVVGRLAQETGVEVELLPSPVTGVTARVTLPQSLLAPSVAIDVSGGSTGAPALSAGRSATDSGAVPIGSPVVLRQINRVPAYDDDPDSTPSAGLPILPYAPASRHADDDTPPSGVPAPVRVVGDADDEPIDAEEVPAHEHEDHDGRPADDATWPTLHPLPSPTAGATAHVDAPDVTGAPAAAAPHQQDDEDDGEPSADDRVAAVAGNGSGHGNGSGYGNGSAAPTGPLPGVVPSSSWSVAASGGTSTDPSDGTAADPTTGTSDGTTVGTPPSGVGLGTGERPILPGRAPAAARWGSPHDEDRPRTPLLPPADASSDSSNPPGSSTPQPAAFARLTPQGAWPGGPGAELTRNGLRKRTPRDRRPAPERRVIDLDAAARATRGTPEAVPDSPADVGARLTALRVGMARGREPGRAGGPDRPEPAAGSADPAAEHRWEEPE